MNPFSRRTFNPNIVDETQPVQSSTLDQVTLPNQLSIATNDPTFNSPPPSRRFWNEPSQNQRNLHEMSTGYVEPNNSVDRVNVMLSRFQPQKQKSPDLTKGHYSQLENIKMGAEGIDGRMRGRMSIEEKQNCRNGQNVNGSQRESISNHQQKNIFNIANINCNSNSTSTLRLQPRVSNNFISKFNRPTTSSLSPHHVHSSQPNSVLNNNPLTSNIFRQQPSTLSVTPSNFIRPTPTAIDPVQSNIFETFSKTSQQQQVHASNQGKPAVMPPVFRKSQLFFNELNIQQKSLPNVQCNNIAGEQQKATSMMQALNKASVLVQNQQPMQINTSQAQSSSQVFPSFIPPSIMNLPQNLPSPLIRPTYQLQLQPQTHQLLQPLILPLYPLSSPIQQNPIKLNTRDPYFQSIRNSPSEMLQLKLADIYMLSLNVLAKKDQFLPKKMNEKVQQRSYADKIIGNCMNWKREVKKELTPFERLKLMADKENANNLQIEPQIQQALQQNQYTIGNTYKQWHDKVMKSSRPQQGFQPQFRRNYLNKKYPYNLIKQPQVIVMKIQNQLERKMKMEKRRNFVQIKQKIDRIQRQREGEYYKNSVMRKRNDKELMRNHSKLTNAISPSTNDKSTPNTPNTALQHQTFCQSPPEIAEFKISLLQQPFTKKYCIVIDSHEESTLSWLLSRLRHGIHKTYHGQMRFERFECDRDMNDAIIRDLLKKEKPLYQLFLESRETSQWLYFSQYSSVMFDSKITAVLTLPLKLKLPQGYDYFYDEYVSGEIKGLVIYNQFVQVCYLEEVLIKEKDERQRDLRKKIRFDKQGVWISCQMLKRRCRVTVWREWGNWNKKQTKKVSLNEDDKKICQNKQENNQIVPIQRNQFVSDLRYDAYPPMISCIMQWKNQTQQRKEFDGLRELRNICFLMIVIILVLGILGHSL